MQKDSLLPFEANQVNRIAEQQLKMMKQKNEKAVTNDFSDVQS
jgi:hypothetical protein